MNIPSTRVLKLLRILPWILAARPKTLTAGLAPVVLGSALAFHVDAFKWVPAILCLVFSILVQIGCNYANDYYDHINGVDTKERIGFTRMVSSGLIAPQAMKMGTCIVLSLAFIVGCGLIYYGGWGLLIVGLASIICAVAYTGGPYPIAYHGFGDLFVFIFYGLVAVAFTFYVQAGYFSAEIFWVASGCGLLAANIRLVNDVRDRNTDKSAGKRTSAVRFGKKYCLFQYSVSIFLAIIVVPVVLIVKYNFSNWTFLSTLLIIWGIKLVKELSQANSGNIYNQVFVKTAKLLLIYAVLLSIGLVIT